MPKKIDLKRRFQEVYANKKVFYPALALFLLVVILGGALFFRMENEKKAQKQAIQIEKQKQEQLIVEKKKAITNRTTFFLNAPAGSRGAINISNYWEGSYRTPDTISNKWTVLDIRDYSEGVPLMYIRYDDKNNFKLEKGEVELKTDSDNYSYAYYFYPAKDYPGADKANFSSMQKDFQESFATFSIF